MTNHLVIVHARYLDLILSGAKTVESRLSRNRHPAATRCRPGDRLYFKAVGGDVLASASVRSLTEYRRIPQGGVAVLARSWSGRVVGGGPDDPYWRSKAGARFALFVELVDVQPCHIPHASFPRSLPWASAWVTGHPSDAVLALHHHVDEARDDDPAR
jgi:hypothetical protein